MKSKYSSIAGIFAVLVLVASFLVPAKLANPEPVEADPGLMEWTIVDTPDSEPALTKSLFTPWNLGSEVIKLLVGNNGNTMYALVRARRTPGATSAQAYIYLYKSIDGGRSWSSAKYNNLMASAGDGTPPAPRMIVWDITIAPDDPNIIAAAISDATNAPATGAVPMAQEVWISSDGGDNWDNTQWPPTGVSQGTDIISTMDISMDYGNGRDVLVGTRDGTGGGTNNISVMEMPGYGGWNVQDVTLGSPVSINPFTGDVIVAKFSPTYVGDSTIALVYSQPQGGAKPGTWLMTGVHDISVNRTTWQAAGMHIELRNASGTPGNSPMEDEIITADLELPSDFSGQSASLRRFYVCTDAINSTVATRGAVTAGIPHRGVYRVDDNVVYTLMDNSTLFATAAQNIPNRRAHSIAYWGTYASGKLLVGETLGHTCQAAVPVWFTDSPTVCPIPCWYPAKKPPTGAAGYNSCAEHWESWGNAWVVWSPTYADQGVAYAVTGSSKLDAAFNMPIAADFASANNNAVAGWPSGFGNVMLFDESAFSLTRNNGETWNQLSLIDTRMSKLTDVAPSPDCTTIYLASVNNETACLGFDSVWRSSINEAVVAPPLPALPIGQVWERVRTSPTNISCNMTDSNYAILRLAQDKLDGQVVFWAAGGTGIDTGTTTIGGFTVGPNTQALAWSPDYGDYWADINPRITVQDMAAESSTILYVLNRSGQVQKLPYTGTAWSSAINTVSAATGGGHTIEAQAEGKVLVGNRAAAPTPFPASISTNGAESFRPMVRPLQNLATFGYHAIFDTDYDDNETVYVANDSAAVGKIYRNKAPSGSNTDWSDMCNVFLGTTHREYYGIVQTNSKNVTGVGTLYAAHDAGSPNATAYCGVERTLNPLMGMPKPGMFWDCMDAADFFRGQTTVVEFTLEPKSLKLCGCLTQDTYTTLYAIDNDEYANNHNVYDNFGGVTLVRDRGMLWAYTDCMAKIGPTLTMDDGTIIGCDPATGRNQEVNFTWEQLCIADYYELYIGKDNRFSQRIFAATFSPASVMSPALIYFAGGGGTYPALFETSGGTTFQVTEGRIMALDCGHEFFWKVRVRDERTDDAVRSPWSEVRSFLIKAGFRVTTPYYGPQLLAPDNGCGCPCDAPLCFSWSPFKETTTYKFELSENSDMSSPLVSTTVSNATAYQYDGTVKCNTNYFWRVMAVEPAPSEWSAVFSFMTQAEEVAPPPPVIPEEVTPLWVWVIIAIGAVLVIVTLVLIFKTRRV